MYRLALTITLNSRALSRARSMVRRNDDACPGSDPWCAVMPDLISLPCEILFCFVFNRACPVQCYYVAATNSEVCEERLDMVSRHVPMESEEPLDPASIRFPRPRGVVLGKARFVDLFKEPHGCRMACEDSNVNIWKYERWQRRCSWD